MKKYFASLSLVLILLACSNDDTQEFGLDDISNFETSIELLEITYSTREVPMKFDDHRLIEINEKMYLRSIGGGYVATSLLEKTTDGRLILVGITCKTIDCSSTTGCIPNSDGKSCSECSAGKCEKTVTGGIQ